MKNKSKGMKLLISSAFCAALLIIALLALSGCGGAGGAIEYDLNPDGQSYTVSGVTNYHITSAEIPNDYKGYPVTAIGARAFEDCDKLIEVVIPASVKRIESEAFRSCKALEKIYIGAGVEDIGNVGQEALAFDYCISLKEIKVDLGNRKYRSVDNCLIDIEAKSVILGCKTSVIPNDGSVDKLGAFSFSDCQKLKSINIPEGITTIGRDAFCGCDELSSVSIPGTVKYIGEGAFACCYELVSINIPAGVERIEDETFSCCYKLLSVNLPEGITYIGCGAFRRASFAVIEIPRSVTEIRYEAFYECPNLTQVVLLDPNGWDGIGADSYSNADYLKRMDRTSLTKN